MFDCVSLFNLLLTNLDLMRKQANSSGVTQGSLLTYNLLGFKNVKGNDELKADLEYASISRILTFLVVYLCL